MMSWNGIKFNCGVLRKWKGWLFSMYFKLLPLSFPDHLVLLGRFTV